MITLGTVNITLKTKKLMEEALRTGQIGQAKYIGDFEKTLAKWFGVKYCIATANGTSADAIVLAAVREMDSGKRNEVIVPALTFIAHINSLYFAHLKPVFVDVKYDCQIDEKRIEERITPQTLAIMPAHLLGKPAKIDKILGIARKYNLYVIEDACESLGSRYRKKLVGTFGDAGCFSFFVSHSITCGEGGAIITNNKKLAILARSLRNHGRLGEGILEKFRFPRIGFSAKMNAMEAIIGLGQIEKLEKILAQRRKNMLYLQRYLGGDILREGKDELIIPHCYPLLLKSQEIRDLAIKKLWKFDIETRQIFSSIPTQEQAYKFLGCKLGEFPVAEEIGERGIYLPCHQNLTKKDLDYIIKCLKAGDV